MSSREGSVRLSYIGTVVTRSSARRTSRRRGRFGVTRWRPKRRRTRFRRWYFGSIPFASSIAPSGYAAVPSASKSDRLSGWSRLRVNSTADGVEDSARRRWRTQAGPTTASSLTVGFRHVTCSTAGLHLGQRRADINTHVPGATHTCAASQS